MYLLKNLSNGNEVDVIYLDYSKAFDKVDHAVSLAIMQHYGITGKVLDWVESFPSNRQQQYLLEVEIIASRCQKWIPSRNSVWVSFVYHLYVIVMIYTLKKLNTLTFADNTKIFKAIIATLCQCFLQEDLNQVVEWHTATNKIILIIMEDTKIPRDTI